MKKIKYLLFGIVSLFGIGCSFAGIQGTFYVDYFDNSGNNSTYSMGYGIPTPALRRNASLSFSLSDYSLSSSVSYGPDNGNSVYYNPNGNRLLYVYYPGDYTTFIFPITSTWQGLGWGDVLSNTEFGIYSRVLCNNTLQSDILTNSSNFCDSSVLFINNHNTYTISSFGDIYDTRIDGVDYYKGPVASSVGLGYSFGFVDGSGWQNDGNHYYLNNSDKFYFRSILLSGSSVVPVDGPLVFRISEVVDGNYQIFALGPIGDYQNFSFIYSIYNCPVSAVTFDDCSFNQGGNVSGDFSYDFTSDNPYSNLIYFLTKDLSQKFWSSYSSVNHTLDLTRVSSTAWQQYTTTITLNLVPSSTGLDILGGIPDNSGGGGNDVDPIFDYNSYVINDLIVCYITSGEICPYNSFNRSAFESSFDVSDSVWDGTSGFLVGMNAYLFLKEFCLNSSFIDYAYCSQLDLYSGALITIDYVNGLLSYDIYGDGIVVSIAGLGSGQLGNVSCWGGGCSNINTGLPNFVRPSDFDYYSGSFIDTGYFDDFFNLQLTGYFMKCPFSYESNRVVIGQSVMNYLGGRDPFVFINCSIAAFNIGKSFNFLDRIDFPGPFMNLSGDSNILGFNTDSNKRLLFGFFDCLLAFGMLLIIRFFYHLFK